VTSFHVIAGPTVLPAYPIVRKIGPADLKQALVKGFDDFKAMPSHVLFLALAYLVIGVCLVPLTSGKNALPLLFPLASGFALIGPFAAIGLYEMSRRRELGLDFSWRYSFEVLRSPAIPSIMAVGFLLAMIFLLWLISARSLYEALFGPAAPESYTHFLAQVFTTSQGWTLIVLGNALGLIFAIIALSISLISFPLLLDRDVGAAVAIQTSFRAVTANPKMIALWGLIVAGALGAGALALVVGLAVVTPILGHATWHLYRRIIAPNAGVAR
jgi:uncharacterized membrane protein